MDTWLALYFPELLHLLLAKLLQLLLQSVPLFPLPGILMNGQSSHTGILILSLATSLEEFILKASLFCLDKQSLNIPVTEIPYHEGLGGIDARSFSVSLCLLFVWGCGDEQDILTYYGAALQGKAWLSKGWTGLGQPSSFFFFPQKSVIF